MGDAAAGGSPGTAVAQSPRPSSGEFVYGVSRYAYVEELPSVQAPPPSGDTTGVADQLALEGLATELAGSGSSDGPVAVLQLAFSPQDAPYIVGGLGDLEFPEYLEVAGHGELTSVIRTVNGARVMFGGDVGGTIARGNKLRDLMIWGGGDVADTGGGLVTNLNEGVVQNVLVVGVGVGDALQELGQNSKYTNVRTVDNKNNGRVLDNGCGTLSHYSCLDYFNGAYNIVFQRSAPSSPGAYAIPTLNKFFHYLAERVGSPGFGTTQEGLGTLHHTAGAFNEFDPESSLVNVGSAGTPSAAAPAVLIEADPAGNSSGRLIFHSVQFTGGGSGVMTAPAIQVGVKSGGNAQHINADYAIVLRGNCIFSGFPNAITYSADAASMDDTYLDGGLAHSRFGTPTFFTADGVGAASQLTNRYPANFTATTTFFAQNAQLTNGLFLTPGFATFLSRAADAASGVILASSAIELPERGDPPLRGAAAGAIYMKDSAGRSKLWIQDDVSARPVLDSTDGGAGGVATLSGTGKVPVTEVDADNTMPWQHSFAAIRPAPVETNFATLAVLNTMHMNGYRTSTGAQNAQVGWDLVLAAGTWTLTLYMSKGTTFGIYTVNIGGVDVGTIDSYNGAGQQNQLGTLAGIAIATTGKYRMLLTMATKNALSTNYTGLINLVDLRRTA